jgi:hypothetical protein
MAKIDADLSVTVITFPVDYTYVSFYELERTKESARIRRCIILTECINSRKCTLYKQDNPL